MIGTSHITASSHQENINQEIPLKSPIQFISLPNFKLFNFLFLVQTSPSLSIFLYPTPVPPRSHYSAFTIIMLPTSPYSPQLHIENTNQPITALYVPPILPHTGVAVFHSVQTPKNQPERYKHHRFRLKHRFPEFADARPALDGTCQRDHVRQALDAD